MEEVRVQNVQGIVKQYCENQVNLAYWTLWTQKLNKRKELFEG